MATSSTPLVNISQSLSIHQPDGILAAPAIQHPPQSSFASTTGSETTMSTASSGVSQTLNSLASMPSTNITVPSSEPSVSSPHAFTPSPIQTYSASNTSSFRRSRSSVVRYWLSPILASIVYAVTLGVAFSASTRYTLLGRVSATLGTWFLAILAKAGDLAFAIAVADTFDCLAWGKLRKRWRVAGLERVNGPRLDWFLALVSSTGLIGLSLLVWKNLQTIWRERSTWTANDWSFLRRMRERWRRWRTARWSLARLVFLAVFIPGPGIILLADIEQKEVFFDTSSMLISGGLAAFNADLATVSTFAIGPDVSRLAQMMLRDRSISWSVDPVGSSCKASKTCTSYLIAGPYRTVQPWPFTAEDDRSNGFRIHQAPFYQADMWNVEPESKLMFNETEECELYGGFDADNENSMTICMKHYTEDTLVAGWKSCQKGYDNKTNHCLEPASLPRGKHGWSTYLRFYRRNATVVFSRSTFTILDASDLSPPQSQNISATSLFTAVNAMLYRPNQTANNFQYDRNSLPYILTQTIGGDLWLSLHETMKGLTIGKDWLKNILVLPVYLFQSTVIATGDNLPTRYQENASTPLLGLPDENYVRGSYCIVDKRSIPGTETVIGYAGVAGFLLLFVAIAKLVAFRWPEADTTEYPLLDYEALTQVVDDSDHPVVLRDRLGPFGNGYNNQGVLGETGGLRVVLRTL